MGEFDVTVTCGYPYTNWARRARRRGRLPRHVFVTQNGDWMVHAKQCEYRFFSCDGLVCTNVVFPEESGAGSPASHILNGVNADVFVRGRRIERAWGCRSRGGSC